MEIVFVFLCLLIILFIGQIVYSERFADCASPGALTWTVSMNPSSCSVTNPVSGSGSASGSTSGSAPVSGSGTGHASGHASGSGHTSGSAHTSGHATGSGAGSRACDSSGSNINLSISDLLALVGSTAKPQQVKYQSSTWTVPSDYQKMYGRPSNQMNRSQMHSQMNTQMPGQMPYQTPYQMPGQMNTQTPYQMPGQMSNQTPSIYQGNQYIQNAPSMNPADYIRKDSIPCYACNLA